jgi:hypothetical protein
MELLEVVNEQTARQFIQVNVEMNHLNPNYIRPINKEIEEVFDREKNKAFRHGECTRWILLNAEGRSIGRIAAFVNKKYKNKGDTVRVGGIGFFDCIHQQEAADTLLDVARHWLLQRGMEAMDGPINFGERDKWWGLVTEGFQEPLWAMNYNPPYYQELFETYGFKVFFNQICFGLDPKKEILGRVITRHAEFAKNPAFSAEHIKKNRLEKYAGDFTTVYNSAYAGHGGLKEMKKDQALLLFKKMKPLMDEKLSWFAYHNGNPVAMYINIPDLNQYFKHFNGKFGLLQKLQFLWLKQRKACKKFTGLVFGLVPEFKGTGLDAYIIVEAAKVIQPLKQYTDYEMQWIGDFNPKMINLAEKLENTFRTRKLVTYRYLFDRTMEFKRHPMVD